MKVLIDESGLIAVEDSIWDNNPIKIFEIFYLASPVNIYTGFDMFVAGYLQRYYKYVDKANIKTLVKNTFLDKSQTRNLITSIFPYVFDFNKRNWKDIKEVIEYYLKDKHKRSDIKLYSFDEVKKHIKDNMNIFMRF